MPKSLSIVAMTWFLVGAALAASAPESAPKPVLTDDFPEGTKYMAAKDYAKAQNAFRAGADKGDARSQNALGFLYLQGLGVPKDLKVALQWIQKSADQGNPRGQSNLGLMYSRGEGVPQDFKLAKSWFEKAAQQGHSPSQASLAAAYLDGKAGPVDLVEAYKWMTIHGEERILKLREAVEKKMTQGQISEGRKRASDWTREFKQRAALNPQADDAEIARAPAPASMQATSGREASPARPSRSHLDARECLKLDDSRAIRICAEKFR